MDESELTQSVGETVYKVPNGRIYGFQLIRINPIGGAAFRLRRC
jgi:hypothetical protein